MKIADFFRGVETVVLNDVVKVFDTAASLVTAANFLPANIKTDLTQLLTDAKNDILGVVGLADTVVGQAVADGVDDITTLLMNTAGVVSSGKPVDQLSVAEKAVFLQTWTAMKAQGDTLAAQFMAGLNPAKPGA